MTPRIATRWMAHPPGRVSHPRPDRSRPERLPLLAAVDVTPVVENAVRTRLRLARDPDDSAAIVSAKEKALAALHAQRSPLGRWSAVLDLWCAGWFWEDGAPPGSALFRELSDRLLRGVRREELVHVDTGANSNAQNDMRRGAGPR